MVNDLRMLLREISGRPPQPRAAIFDAHTLQSTPESGERAGYDGHKRRKGSKVHLAVDTLGQLLAGLVTPANEQKRAQVNELAAKVQEVTGDAVEVAFVDQGCSGDQPAADAQQHGIQLEFVKLPAAKRGFVLLPRRRVVERSFTRMARFRRLARDDERLADTLLGLHFVAFAILLARRFIDFMTQWGKLAASGYWLDPKQSFAKVYVTDATEDDLELVAEDLEELAQVDPILDDLLNRSSIELDMEVWGSLLEEE